MELESVYKQKPWLKSYPPGVSGEVEIREVSLCEAFDEATEKWKSQTALVFYGRKISFGKLREMVDRFANALYDLGVRKGDRIGLLLLNCPQYFVAFYGALKAGAILSPISPVYVSPEIKYQLEDSGVENLICQDILYEPVERANVKLKNVIFTNIGEFLPASKRFLGKSILRGVYQKMALPSPIIFEREGYYRFQDLISRYPPTPPEVEINPREDIVSLSYTGGTTGPPKGAMITHYNHMGQMATWKAFFTMLEDGKEVTLAFAPLNWMGGQATWVVDAIIQGYTTVAITTPNLDDIISAMIDYKGTMLWAAPSLFEMLKDYEKANRVNWKNLKMLSSSADTLHQVTLNDWERRTGVQLSDIYGMTEAIAIIATPPGKIKAGSVGIPLPGVMVAVLDPDNDEFLPVSEIGEIATRAPQVCKGYWKKPEATRECEAIIDGEKWWRTGDLGRMDKDGYFYVYDRKRDLIKYKGLRVFAREVEEVLKTHPKIREVGVIGVEDIKVGENVKAFVVLETEARGKVSEADIVQYCQDKLAHYKIPKVIDFVGEISKTDAGKVSRRELREMEE